MPDRFRHRFVRRAALDHERHDVEIDEPVRRIKNLHVPAEGGVRLREGLPIEPADLFLERFADRLVAVEAEDVAGRVVEIGNAPLGVGHDDPFLDGIENRLEETFLLGEAEQIILHLLRSDAAEALNQFFEESRFHRCSVRDPQRRGTEPLR